MNCCTFLAVLILAVSYVHSDCKFYVFSKHYTINVCNIIVFSNYNCFRRQNSILLWELGRLSSRQRDIWCGKHWSISLHTSCLHFCWSGSRRHCGAAWFMEWHWWRYGCYNNFAISVYLKIGIKREIIFNFKRKIWTWTGFNGSVNDTGLNVSLKSKAMQGIAVCDTICHHLTGKLTSSLFILMFFN